MHTANADRDGGFDREMNLSIASICLQVKHVMRKELWKNENHNKRRQLWKKEEN